jgi:UDP-glucose 4-epimerase
MRVLITGGAGFIGSHLAEAYLGRGDQVDVLDDLSTGSIDNVRHLLDHPGFRLTTGSVLDSPDLPRLVARCDAVVHLAAAVGVRRILGAPVQSITTNVAGTEAVLARAAEGGKKVFVASTSEVYGLSDRVPFREDGPVVLGPTISGRWSYACSKALDEFLAFAYAQERGLPVVVARFFNAAGPRQTGRYGMVIPTFVRQALAGRPITVHGDGTQTRCFCHVGDVVAAVMGLVDHPGAVGGVFNVGSSEEVSINELVEVVRDVVGSPSEIVHVPYREAYEVGFEDMPRRVPDTTKVRDLIGFRPTLDLRAIVTRVAEYYRRVESYTTPRPARPTRVSPSCLVC